MPIDVAQIENQAALDGEVIERERTPRKPAIEGFPPVQHHVLTNAVGVRKEMARVYRHVTLGSLSIENGSRMSYMLRQLALTLAEEEVRGSVADTGQGFAGLAIIAPPQQEKPDA